MKLKLTKKFLKLKKKSLTKWMYLNYVVEVDERNELAIEKV